MSEVMEFCERVITNIEKVIIGKRATVSWRWSVCCARVIC